VQIIITLAGHSRRFKKEGYNIPKFLIKINRKTVLEYVIDMFDINDNFFFILNKLQVRDNPNLKKWLKKLCPQNEIIEIEPHEKGPIFSIDKIKKINQNEPIIVSYCDFFVDWDYDKFKREVFAYKCAIPAFKGFHPASFGKTLYAYMKVDKNNHLIQLKEKESFTKNRINEFASAGIYYFENWSFLNKYLQKFKLQKNIYKEAYVSLLSNLIVADKEKVKITEIKKFICLGTPHDLEHYNFWSEYFLKNFKSKLNNKNIIRDTINIIPFAGKGSRFKKDDYRTIKPLISVASNPMIIRASKSLPNAEKWIYIGMKKHFEKYKIEKLIYNQVSKESQFIKLNKITKGPLITCEKASKDIDLNKSILISSCDYEIVYNKSKWAKILKDKRMDVVIWCVKSQVYLLKDPNAFAYCKINNNTGYVSKISEKKTISKNPQNDFLAVGIFWFRYSNDFIYMSNKAREKKLTINNEYYIANSINLLLKKGKKVAVFEADQWISFGDPFELKVYEYWQDHFNKF